MVKPEVRSDRLLKRHRTFLEIIARGKEDMKLKYFLSVVFVFTGCLMFSAGCGPSYLSEAETPVEEQGEVPPEETPSESEMPAPENGEEPGV